MRHQDAYDKFRTDAETYARKMGADCVTADVAVRMLVDHDAASNTLLTALGIDPVAMLNAWDARMDTQNAELEASRKQFFDQLQQMEFPDQDAYVSLVPGGRTEEAMQASYAASAPQVDANESVGSDNSGIRWDSDLEDVVKGYYDQLLLPRNFDVFMSLLKEDFVREVLPPVLKDDHLLHRACFPARQHQGDMVVATFLRNLHCKDLVPLQPAPDAPVELTAVSPLKDVRGK